MAIPAPFRNVVNEQLSHRDLIAPSTLDDALRIAVGLDHVCQGETPSAALVAMTAYYLSVCRCLDVDPDETFTQVWDVLASQRHDLQLATPNLHTRFH